MRFRHTRNDPPASIQGRGLSCDPWTASVAPPEVYGWARIWAGSWFLSDFDPGWWGEGGFVPSSLAALDMADPYSCVLAWWAARYLPDDVGEPQGPRQVPPYYHAVRALRLSSLEAEALGFTGVDADVLTAGWRHLITCLRASREHRGGKAGLEIARVELSEPSMAAGLRLAARLPGPAAQP
jgi:hypothetical protein